LAESSRSTVKILSGCLRGENMGSDKINRWISLGANIGVIIGLIMLVIEVRHANNLAEASAYRSRGDEIQASLNSVALSADLAEILVKVDSQGVQALSDVETKRFWAYLRAGIFRMQNQFNDYNLGYLDDDSYQAMLTEAARRYPWWKELDIAVDDPDFGRAIEAALREKQSD
jgi:hypothetical protein